MTGAAALDELAADIERVLDDVRSAVEDWAEDARAGGNDSRRNLGQAPPPLSTEELGEGKAFLSWLAENNFTFLGYRRHELTKSPGKTR